MPPGQSEIDPDALSQALALQAIQQIGQEKFTVSAVQDVARPETLRNFKLFGDALAYAYQQGRDFAFGHATEVAADAQEGHEHEMARLASEHELVRQTGPDQE